MKIFFDTEFTGLHKNTSLISLGMVDENGRSFYAEFTDYDKTQVDDWIQKNVINNLINDSNKIDYESDNWVVIGDKDFICTMLKKWLKDYDYVQLVSDVCHYDMVLFIDIFGTAFDLPENVCPACYDINQLIAEYYGITLKAAFDLSREEIIGDNTIDGDKHNALYDARVIKEIYYRYINISRQFKSNGR